MPAGYITLGQISARLSALEVSCKRCDRRGRLNLDRLIAKHGQQLPIPELRRIIAADCPRMIEGKISDPCGVHFPGLVGKPVNQIVSGSKAKYAPSSPKIIAIVSTYARMAPSSPSDRAEPIRQAVSPLCRGAHRQALQRIAFRKNTAQYL